MVTVAQSLALAQAWMSDTAQEVFSDAVLIKFAPSVYRDIQRFMTQNGEPRLKGYAEFTLPIQTSEATELVPGFPLDMIEPIALWERSTSESFANYVDMEEAFPWLTPRGKTQILTHWEWKDSKLLFIGANTDRVIRVHYSKLMTDLVDENSFIELPDSADALAMGMVVAAATGHGSPLADSAQTVYQRTLNQLVDRNETQSRVQRSPKWYDRSRMKPGKEIPSNG